MRDALDLAEVRLVPAHVPPHRPQPAASAEHRIALLRLAVRGVPGIRVDERELGRAGPSYTVDTLTELRTELGARPLCLLVGEDAFRGLPTWHRWQALFELAHIVVMQRPPLPDAADAPATLAAFVAGREAHSPSALAAAPAGLVWRQPIPPLDISATRIRALLRAGHSARFLMTDSCLRYIRGHHLYTD
jgi:nicotinate-nucleotide adenylyltransferase